MAEVLPINFPLPSESAVASYNYYDIAEGTGIKLFYGCGISDSTGQDYILTENQIYPAQAAKEITGTTTSASYALTSDTDFDLTAFNTPRTIRGTAYINFCFGAATSDGGAGYTKIIAKLRKWDGSTETEIASNTSEELVTTTAFTNRLASFTITIPETHFKIGEQLRLTMLQYAYTVGGTKTTTTTYGCDPMNMDGTITPSTDDTAITQLKLWIPFKLDL